MSNDTYATPVDVFDAIRRRLNMPILFDVCADEWNAKTRLFFSAEDDALTIPWAERIGELVTGDQPDLKSTAYAAWMNPPYSDPYPWCEKANEESEQGLIIVGLLPDDRSTLWYQDHIEGQASLCFVPNRRISFIDPDTGEPKPGNPKGSVFPVWTPWRTGRTEYIRFNLPDIDKRSRRKRCLNTT